MTGDVLLAGGVLSLSARAAELLIARGNGDAALLYLALLRHSAPDDTRRALGWATVRFETAWAELTACGLADAAPPAAVRTPPEPDEPPEYLQADVAGALEGDSAFAALARELERRLGKLLSTADLKTLYSLYDYLNMPPEVILLAAAWCSAESGDRPPRMPQVKKTVYRWHRLGLTSADAAEEFLRLQHALSVRERGLLPTLGITGRAPLENERNYIASWVAWGFPDDAIRLAYERTLMNKQKMNWAYMNSILRSWHGKGLHTVAEIRAGDGPRKGGKAPPSPAKRDETARRDLEDLRRILGKQGDGT